MMDQALEIKHMELLMLSTMFAAAALAATVSTAAELTTASKAELAVEVATSSHQLLIK